MLLTARRNIIGSVFNQYRKKKNIIVRGRVEVLKRIDDRDTCVKILEDGDFFGEIALLSNVPRTATVRTVNPTLLISLKRSRFLKLTNSVPGMRDKLEKTMGIRLEESSLSLAIKRSLKVLIVYVIMCLDEIVKVPFLKWHYNKYIWVKNLTREVV